MIYGKLVVLNIFHIRATYVDAPSIATNNNCHCRIYAQTFSNIGLGVCFVINCVTLISYKRYDYWDRLIQRKGMFDLAHFY